MARRKIDYSKKKLENQADRDCGRNLLFLLFTYSINFDSGIFEGSLSIVLTLLIKDTSVNAAYLNIIE